MKKLAPFAGLLLASCSTVQDKPQLVPYIDAHSHILPDYTAAGEVRLFRDAGLAAVVIMHPDTATIDAMRLGNEGYIVPTVSIARLPEMPGLRLSAGTAGSMAALVDGGKACGFGEIPTRIVPRTEPTDDLSLLNADRMAIYSAANARGVMVNMHIDIASPAVEASVARIALENPKAQLVLAHSGWSAAPETIERLMARHPNIHADLSVRLDPAGGLPASPQPAGSLPPGASPVISILQDDGSLQPAWAKVLQRFPERFLFAMDITDRERPKYIALLMATARRALAPLGTAEERAIAHGNVERLLKGCQSGFKR